MGQYYALLVFVFRGLLLELFFFTLPFVVALQLVNWKRMFDTYSLWFVVVLAYSWISIGSAPLIQIHQLRLMKKPLEQFLVSIPDTDARVSDPLYHNYYFPVEVPKPLVGYVRLIDVHKSHGRIEALFFLKSEYPGRAYLYYDSDHPDSMERLYQFDSH